MGWLADETGLGKTAANYVPLTPLSFLRRAASVWPDQLAVVYGPHRKTYGQYIDRVTRLASALVKVGVQPGDVVATLLPNIPAQAEAHFAVPACGAVLNAINTRLDVTTVAYILDHGGAKLVLCDPQFLPVLAEAVDLMDGPAPTIIEVADPHAGVHADGNYPEYRRCRF
jgi:fatty-acyl-CoA synthase